MPNLPEEESGRRTPPLVSNGNHAVNGYEELEDQDEWEQDNEDLDGIPHANVIRMRLVEGNEGEESTEGSEEEEPLEEPLDLTVDETQVFQHIPCNSSKCLNAMRKT